ncbi:hypothetical protein BCAL_0364, partial [Bifidobacterium callitrichos DSM 23973]
PVRGRHGPVRQMRRARPAVRPVGRAALAPPRPRVRQAPVGVRAPARHVPRARGDGRDGAVGAQEERVHARLRAAGRVVERARAQKRRVGADAHRLEERGPRVQKGRRRPAGRTGGGPVRPSAFHRRGRDQLPQGPQVHDRGRRPRPRQGRMDARGARGEGVRPVLRDAHRGAARLHPGRHRRRGPVDRRVRVPLVPAGRTHPRRVPHRVLGDRRARQGTNRRMARGPEERRRQKGREGPGQGRQMGAAEERGRPDRRPEGPTGMHRQHQRDPLGGVQAQGTPAHDPQTDRRQSRPPAAPMGRGRVPVRHPRIRPARREDRQAPLRHPHDHPQRTVQRQARGREQQDQDHHQNRLRLPQPRQPHRPRHAQMRRTQPTTPRTPITSRPNQ